MSDMATGPTMPAPEPIEQRQGRERFDAILRSAGMVGWEWDVEGNRVHHLGDIQAMTGAIWSEGERFFSFIHPDDRGRVAEALRRTWLDGSEYRETFRIIRRDGSLRWMSDVGRAAVLADGRRWMTGVLTDITDRKLAEAHERLLVNELNHRVKNTLAIIQGIAGQTFRGDGSEAARIFESRLLALSAAHNVLTRENWTSARLAEVVEDAVRPFQDEDESRIEVHGDDVRVPPKTAVGLALALHELGANAVRYGALSEAAGRVAIDWHVDASRLKLCWRESGGPPVQRPTSRGFGVRMIERGLAAELGGTVTLAFDPAGVVCTVDAPVPSLEAIDG